jgi:hypothetical protein
MNTDPEAAGRVVRARGFRSPWAKEPGQPKRETVGPPTLRVPGAVDGSYTVPLQRKPLSALERLDTLCLINRWEK